MAVLGGHKTVGAGFSNDAQIVRVMYDFSVDGGSVADYDVLTAANACIIEMIHADVKTAVTSGGTTAIDLGKNAGGAEFFSDVAKGELAIDVVAPADAYATAKVELAAGEKIVLGIETAAFTAGKFEMLFRVYSR